MLPKWHILFGAIFSIIIYLLGVSSVNSTIVFLASILIDIDHYIFYVRKINCTINGADNCLKQLSDFSELQKLIVSDSRQEPQFLRHPKNPMNKLKGFFDIQRKGKISLKSAYYWHKNLPKNHKPIMEIFHTVEFILFILFLSIFSQYCIFIFIGLIFHSIFDIIEIFKYKNLNAREFFLIRYLLTKDKSKYL